MTRDYAKTATIMPMSITCPKCGEVLSFGMEVGSGHTDELVDFAMKEIFRPHLEGC